MVHPNQNLLILIVVVQRLHCANCIVLQGGILQLFYEKGYDR